MGITLRRYKLLQDFDLVNDFLNSNYSLDMTGSIEQPFWEYGFETIGYREKWVKQWQL